MSKFGESTHSDKLERWLGTEQVSRISDQFKDFYYPVRLNGVAGEVYVMPGGDFSGKLNAGSEMSAKDSAEVVLRKLMKRAERLAKHDKMMAMMLDMIRAEDNRMLSVGAFASIDAVVAAWTGGKGQVMPFSKTGTASNAIGNSNDLWTNLGTPGAGAAGAASPAGSSPTSATTGALAYKNLGTANTGHYLNWALNASVINNSLLLYDRIFSVIKTMNSAAAQAITGVPARYQSITAGADNYIGGNFAFPSNPTTVLAATAHGWASCTYLDDTNAAGTFNTMTGVSACVAHGVDLSVGNWFMGLAAGDVGVKALTNIQCSAAVATGTIDFVIGHPIAVNVCPVANLSCLDDGLYTSMNLTHIEDNAALAFLELNKPATTATNYNGLLRLVSE